MIFQGCKDIITKIKQYQSKLVSDGNNIDYCVKVETKLTGQLKMKVKTLARWKQEKKTGPKRYIRRKVISKKIGRTTRKIFEETYVENVNIEQNMVKIITWAKDMNTTTLPPELNKRNISVG